MNDKIRLRNGEEMPVGRVMRTMDLLEALLASGQQLLVGHLVDWIEGRVIPDASVVALRGHTLLIDGETNEPHAFVKAIVIQAVRRVDGKLVLGDVFEQTAENREVIRAYRARQNERVRQELGLSGKPGED